MQIHSVVRHEYGDLPRHKLSKPRRTDRHDALASQQSTPRLVPLKREHGKFDGHP